MTGKRKIVDTLPVNSCVVTYVSFAGGLPQKKGVNPNTSQHQSIKYEKCFLCRSLELCCYRSTCGGQIAQFWGKMHSPGGWSIGHSSPQGRLNFPLLASATSELSDNVTIHHKWLCKSPQEPLPDGGIACTYTK